MHRCWVGAVFLTKWLWRRNGVCDGWHLRNRETELPPDLLQLLGNGGSLDKRQPHEMFHTAARDSNVPVHAE